MIIVEQRTLTNGALVGHVLWHTGVDISRLCVCGSTTASCWFRKLTETREREEIHTSDENFMYKKKHRRRSFNVVGKLCRVALIL